MQGHKQMKSRVASEEAANEFVLITDLMSH